MNCRKLFEDWKYAFGWLTIFAIVFGAVFTFYAVVFIRGYNSDNQVNTVTIAGYGEVVAVPDIASISFSVTETSESVKSAQDLASEKINKVFEYLKGEGVEEKDIKTTSYDIYPKYEWINKGCDYGEICSPRGNRELVGYEVSQRTQIKVRDTSKAGGVLSGLGSFEVQQISGLSFTVDDVETLKEEARDKAIADAIEKSKRLEKALGVKFVKIISYYENDRNISYDVGYSKEVLMDSVRGNNEFLPEISTGEKTITSSINISYKIR